MNSIYPIFVILVATRASLSTTQQDLRVYHGARDLTAKYPYVVCLKAGSTIHRSFVLRVCTGSLIAENWVLTAAHCLIDEITYIQYGNMAIPLPFTPSKSRVLKIFQHPRYMEALPLNDIGLLLVTSVPMSNYARLSAVDYKSLLGQRVEYAGYGQTYLENRHVDNKMSEFLEDHLMRPLQIGKAIVKTCDDEFLSKNLICLASKCDYAQTVLPGDSGGPLFYDEKLVAVACVIVSDYSSQAFTPISSHITWIQNVVSQHIIE